MTQPNIFTRRQMVGAAAGATIAASTALAQEAKAQQAGTEGEVDRNTGAARVPLLLQGGMVVDGTGRQGRRADVRVVGDLVVAVGRVAPEPGDMVLDVRGLCVCPGFIDTHSHIDGELLQIPTGDAHIRQGITTSIVGQDGGSHLPLADWFARVQATQVAPNIASFAGHGTLRSKVTGENYKRTLTPDEQQQVNALVAAEMAAGALGLSTGLEYDPGFYTTTEELISAARVAGQSGGIYISHVRDEGNEALKSFAELMRIAREARLPAEISHIKLDTQPSWGQAQQVLRSIEDANRQGQDIRLDVYPYLFWQSTITVLIPSRDWQNRALWEKGLAEVGGPEHVRLTTYRVGKMEDRRQEIEGGKASSLPSSLSSRSFAHPWQGKTIAEIAQMTGRDAIRIVQEIVQNTHGPGANGQESVVVTAMTEADLDRFIASPRSMFCTDGSLRPTHPRGAGSFPRILGHYVRERRLLTLPAAIHKMTGLAAMRMGFAKRGLALPGYFADLVVFDPKTVADRATIENPAAPPVGLPHVIVNGQFVLRDGQITGARPGIVLKHVQKSEE